VHSSLYTGCPPTNLYDDYEIGPRCTGVIRPVNSLRETRVGMINAIPLGTECVPEMPLFRHPCLVRGVVHTDSGAFVISRGIVDVPEEVGQSFGWIPVEDPEPMASSRTRRLQLDANSSRAGSKDARRSGDAAAGA